MYSSVTLLFLGPMRLEECYRSLGLKPGASREQVKTAYRALARKFHPDMGNQSQPLSKDVTQHENFLRITAAYKHLLQTFAVDRIVQPISSPRSEKPDDLIKYQAYQRLRQLFSQQKIAHGIALVEALTARLPDDPEVKQWRAIAYQQQGRHLVQIGQYDQALRYLQKALTINPTNRNLVATLHQDLKMLQHQVKHHNLLSP